MASSRSMDSRQGAAKVNKLDYIVEFMRTNKLTKFCDLLTSEEPEIRLLNEKLNLLNQFTLFVPTNEAILLMPPSHMEQIKASAQETKQFLLAHATSELVTPKTTQTAPISSAPQATAAAAAAAIAASPPDTSSLIFSLAGSPLHVTTGSGPLPAEASGKLGQIELIVNGANIMNGHSYALQEQNNSNSATYAIVHLIDRVLYPAPSLKLRDMLRQLAPKMARYLELASDKQLDAQLSSISHLTTVFAPNDDAFKLVPKKVIDQLETNRTFLVNFIRGHLIEGLHYGALLTTGAASDDAATEGLNITRVKLNSFSGTELQFELKRVQSRNLILVNSVPIIEQDLVGLNGLVHLIARPIFEGHLSETCRCGLTNSQQVGTRLSAGNFTRGGPDAAAYEKLWLTSSPNGPSANTPSEKNGTAAAAAAGTGGGGLVASSSVDWASHQGDRSDKSGGPEGGENGLGSGNELEREESNQSPVIQQDNNKQMALMSQRIRAQRSGLVTRNNKDFYRPLAAPANLLMISNEAGEANARRQPEQQRAFIVPPIGLVETSDIQRQRAATSGGKQPEVSGSGVSSFGQGDKLTGLQTAPSDHLFEVERYRVILNATTRQRMREQQQQQQPQQQGSMNSASARQFTYDRPLLTTPGTGDPVSSDTSASFGGTRRPYSQVNATPSSFGQSVSGGPPAGATEQLTLSASSNSSRQQRLLKFQPEDARDLTVPRLRETNMTRPLHVNAASHNVAYSVLAPSSDDQQGIASSSRQQQAGQQPQMMMTGKTVAPTGGGFGGCAFYDTDCKRLFGRLVRLPAGNRMGQKVAASQENNQQFLANTSSTADQNPQVGGSIEQHIDSTFGETTETPLGGGWTKSMLVQSQQQGSQKLQQQQQQQPQQQQPVKPFHRLSPARTSPLNQPLPPWSDEERQGRPPVAPNWRAQDRDIARITGPYVGPDKKHEQSGAGFGFTSGISRESTSTASSGKLSAATRQPQTVAAEQIYLTPVGVIKAPEIATRHQALRQQNHSTQRQPDPQDFLKDGSGAIFVSPSPILRISQPTRNTNNQPIIRPGQQATIGFSNQQYHTPTPYSVSLVTTHLPPMFNTATGSPAKLTPPNAGQFSRLTNFTAFDHGAEDPPLTSHAGSTIGSSSNKRFPVQFELQQQQQQLMASHIPRAPAAHRKQRLQQLQMDNNGSFGANFELNPASGEKQSQKVVRLQTNMPMEPPPARQTILANWEELPKSDISVTSAKLNPGPSSLTYGGVRGGGSTGNQITFGALATQASNQAPNVSGVSSSNNNNNLIRSAPLLDHPDHAGSGSGSGSSQTDQATDFFQDRTIAEILDDSGLRIDGQQVTFARLKECLRDADLLNLVSQTGSSVTIFMPTDSAFHRLVQQQAIAQQQQQQQQQRGLSSLSASSSGSSRSSRLLDPARRHLLPLVARRAKSGLSQESGSVGSGGTSLVAGGGWPSPLTAASGHLLSGNADVTTTSASGATNAAERLTLDCSSSQLRQILLDHLSASLITPKQLQHDLGITSLNGHQLLLSSVPSKKIVVVDGQPVIAATRAKNGMVYVVNKFLNLTQQVPNVVDLMETQQNLTTFLSYLNFSSLADRLKRETGPMTVLAPTNEAFEQLSSSARQLINSDPAALMDILRGHIVEGVQFGKLLSMRNQLKTMNPDQQIDARVIKPNFYLFDNQMTSMRLVGTTGNGVVNSIDRLIVPAWLKVTLDSGSNIKPPTSAGGSNLFISSAQQLNPNTLGGGPSAARNRPLFVGELEGDSFVVSGGSAPIIGNSASPNLPVISNHPVRFEQPSNRETNFVSHSPNNFLLAADANLSDSLNNSIHSTTNGNNNNFINGRLDPLPATNSVDTHMANNNNQSPFLRVANNLSSSTLNAPKRTLIETTSPQSSSVPLNVNVTTKNMQLIEKLANLMQARKFVKYLIRSGVSEQLKPDMNYVILVPTDQAIDKLPKQIIDMLERDSERLADLMNYHILDTTFEYINTIPDGQTLNTLNEKDILFNWHRNNTILTASGAVVMGGIQEDNIALLIVDRVLYPTPGDILNIISKSPILSKFTSLVRNAGLERQLTLAGPYSLFAPSDFAFNQLDQRDMDTLQRNKETARRFLLRHLSQPTVFTSSIALSNGTQMLITNSLGEDLILRQRNDYFSVNDVNFSYADVAATNGVVHVIDGLL